jgi:ribosomal protein S18 acetylase RimI-like enzyme
VADLRTLSLLVVKIMNTSIKPKRAVMRAELAAAGGRTGPDIRSFDPADVQTLGALMYRAYLNTIDYEGETLEQSIAEVVKTIQGDYGPFVASCSMLVLRQGSPVSATLITRFENRPFVAFTFTDQAFAGQGLARMAMQAAMAELLRQGERELRLVVTLANAPAVALYTKLGFKFEE